MVALGLVALAGVGVVLLVRNRSSLSRHLDTAPSRLDELQGRDPLTGLVTRPDFEAALDDAVLACDRGTSALALRYGGLDNFRPLNDGYGHRVADAVLVQAAQHLQACTSRPLAVAGVGGDEFALLVGARLGDAGSAAAKVLHALQRPFTVQGLALRLGASVHRWALTSTPTTVPGRGDVRVALGCNELRWAATGCKAIGLPSP